MATSAHSAADRKNGRKPRDRNPAVMVAVLGVAQSSRWLSSDYRRQHYCSFSLQQEPSLLEPSSRFLATASTVVKLTLTDARTSVFHSRSLDVAGRPFAIASFGARILVTHRRLPSDRSETCHARKRLHRLRSAVFLTCEQQNCTTKYQCQKGRDNQKNFCNGIAVLESIHLVVVEKAKAGR